MMQMILLVILSAVGVNLALAAPPDPATPPKPTAFDLQRESLKKQRESIKAQLGPDIQALEADFGFLTAKTPLAPAAQQPDCPALAQDTLNPLIAAASKKQSLSADLIRTVMVQESGLKPCAVSYKGAQGLMQLMPETATQLNVSDPFDPEQNIQAGSAYLKQLLKRYKGDLRLALIGYNAGMSVADDQGARKLPQETEDYVSGILGSLGSKVNAIESQERPAAASKEIHLWPDQFRSA